MRGARVQALRPGRRHELLLETYRAGEGLRCWTISADPEAARWVETFAQPDRPAPRVPALLRPAGTEPKAAGTQPKAAGSAEPKAAAGTDPFLLLARARLEGGRCTGFDQPAPQTVRLTVETEAGEWRLVLELHRPHPSLLLLDGEERVLACLPAPVAQHNAARQDAARQRAARHIAIGQPYAPLAEPRGFRDDLPRTPRADREEARRLDERWRARMAEQDLARVRVAAGRLTRQAVTRLERRLSHLEGDRQAAADAERYRRWGELLKIHGGAWHPGAIELRVPDEFDPGRAEAAIPLDPALSLADNIAALFRQYRKRRGAEAHVLRRIAETERDLAAARASAQGVAAAPSADAAEDALRLLPGMRAPQSVLPRDAGGVARGAKARGAAAHGALERTSSDGLTLLVGRSAEENDALTFRTARGRDWWLHALGFPGSHVVVRNPAGGALPPATLREAAWLAAYYSKARRQGQVEVAYVERKHVRRVPKGKPGQVTYAHGHTLWVDVADARLKRVLGATEPDATDEADGPGGAAGAGEAR